MKDLYAKHLEAYEQVLAHFPEEPEVLGFLLQDATSTRPTGMTDSYMWGWRQRRMEATKRILALPGGSELIRLEKKLNTQAIFG